MTTVLPCSLAGASSEDVDAGLAWRSGSVIEYNPPPWGRWMPALITGTSVDGVTLTVEFVMMGVPHQHAVHRSSALVAPLGVHEQGLPPGFWARPSKSRPGQLAFSDKVTGARYGSSELAWKVHLERVLRMESLPTVCDENPSNKLRFMWPAPVESPMETPGKNGYNHPVMPAGFQGSPMETHGGLPLAPACPDVHVKAAQDNGHVSASDDCFSADVFAELMAAPSPAAVPMELFKNAYQNTENDGGLNKENDKVVVEEKFKHALLYPCSPIAPANIVMALASMRKDCAPAPEDPIEPKLQAAPHERVAELEGALEASRDRVKELESTFVKGPGELKLLHTKQCESMPYVGMAPRSQCAESESARSDIYPQSQAGESVSALSEPRSAQESFERVEELLQRIIAEETLLNKAIEIADLRRAAHDKSGNRETLEDCEPRFAELQKEIRERELRLLELSQVHQKKEEDLEKLRLALQSHEQANTKFEEHLRHWESQLSISTPVVAKRQARHSMPCSTPPKLPLGKPGAFLARVRRTSRSPSRAGSRAGSASVPVPVCGAAGRAAAEAAAAVAAMVIRNGPPRQGSSARGATSAGSPEGSHGFRTPRRSLSPATLFPRRHASPCASVVGTSSIRSGYSTTVPSETSSCIIVPEGGRRSTQQVRCYTGAFSHPCLGPDEIPLEVTIYNSCDGWWKAIDKSEDITVQRDGKNVIIADKAGATKLDGHEVVGGILIGAVVQNGEGGGKFRLQPCKKVLKRTCIQRPLIQMPMVTRWRAVGIPPKIAVQPSGEVGWHTTYQMAFS